VFFLDLKFDAYVLMKNQKYQYFQIIANDMRVARIKADAISKMYCRRVEKVLVMPENYEVLAILKPFF
jgi:hypothetical protein